MNLNILAFVFKNEVHCKMCNSGLDMQVLKGKSGLPITFVLKCFACPYRVEFSSSNFHEGTQIATINTRFVYAMRSIGKGAEAGRMFCGVMNIPQPPTRFSPYAKRILNAAKLLYEDSIQNATKEAICENEGNKNIAVAVDETWQKRGCTTLNGVVTVTSIDTGKVRDVDILSKYCACKNLPFHEKDCKRNYVGSSGAMEIQGASKFFQRSLSLHNARYITYLGDGDCKAFDAVKKKNVYGNEYPIEKLECIGHVMKRMGTRLSRLKAQLKGQTLPDGKCLSRKNRLTEHEIDNLQSYYGSAIRRNHSSFQNMRQAIWAIFLHKLSTDETPQHGFCPIGEDYGVDLKSGSKIILDFDWKSLAIQESQVEDMKVDDGNLRVDLSETKLNVVANVLDNNTIESIIGESYWAIIRDLILSSRDQLIEEQKTDPELGHMYRYLENPEDSSVNAAICENWSRDFRQVEGLLFHVKYATSLGEMREYIPQNL
ncbi:uncharacterized protein TNCV_3006661 [Trichonephila clavipes]|nr:uncharacterized protein TNCV_3006661 [Trichonephila clavipes]